MNFIYYLVVAALLTRLPFIGTYFRLVNTLIHELGHCIFSILTLGRPTTISLFTDASGAAITSNFWLGRIVVSLAGYPTSSLVAYGMVIWLHDGNYKWMLWGLMIMGAVSFALWVRNLFGLLWTLSFLGLTYLVYTTDLYVVPFLSLVTAILVVDSVISAFVVCKLSIVDPKNSGDAQNLARSTLIPSLVWGMLFFGQAIFLLYYGMDYWSTLR